MRNDRIKEWENVRMKNVRMRNDRMRNGRMRNARMRNARMKEWRDVVPLKHFDIETFSH